MIYSAGMSGLRCFVSKTGRPSSIGVIYWDDIQARQGPNALGHTMTDEPTRVCDRAMTVRNRAFVKSCVETVLIGGALQQLPEWVDVAADKEHNPRLSDDVAALRADLSDPDQLSYQHLHRVLAEGDFVPTVCEGRFKRRHSAFYDLFRAADHRSSNTGIRSRPLRHMTSGRPKTANSDLTPTPTGPVAKLGRISAVQKQPGHWARRGNSRRD